MPAWALKSSTMAGGGAFFIRRCAIYSGTTTGGRGCFMVVPRTMKAETDNDFRSMSAMDGALLVVSTAGTDAAQHPPGTGI